MKRPILTLAAASLLVGAPFAARADDDDRRHRWHGGHDRHHRADYGPGWKHGHWKAPKRVEHYYYYPPRVVHAPVVVRPPVYVPAPVVAVPAPYPYPYPPNSVDIGFRIFF